jgi:hypothetical protein
MRGAFGPEISQRLTIANSFSRPLVVILEALEIEFAEIQLDRVETRKYRTTLFDVTAIAVDSGKCNAVFFKYYSLSFVSARPTTRSELAKCINKR